MRQAKVIFAVIFAAALAGAVCAGFSAQAEAGASAAEVVREVAVAEGDIDPVLLQAVDQQLAKLPAAMLDRMLAEGWVVCVTERDLAVGFDAYDTVYGLCEPAQQTLFMRQVKVQPQVRPCMRSDTGLTFLAPTPLTRANSTMHFRLRITCCSQFSLTRF